MQNSHNHKNHDGHDNINHSEKNHDHTEHHKMMIKDFRKRFFVSLVVTVPILLLSPLIQDFLNLQIRFPFDKYVLLVLSAFVFAYGGWPFLKGLKNELQNKNPGMMTLIALAITVAFVYSAAVVLGLAGKLFFWELATLIDVMLLGHWLEMRSVVKASGALQKLAELLPARAHLMKNGDVEDVEISKLQKGDKVLVKVGEKIPADGEIFKGRGYVDESMLTGESKPVKKQPGDELVGGSVNGEGIFEMEITGTGEDSYLSKVINLVREAQADKSKTQKLADKAAKWLTIVAIGAGIITFTAWIIFSGDLAFAIERMATVMVITCPHALGLAIPLVAAVSTAKSAKRGLLIRDRNAFENARKITTVVFDKTGTLTKGEFGVSKIFSLDDNYSEEKILRLAYTLEKKSEHPIGAGISKKAEKESIKSLEVLDFKVLKGSGVQGRVNDKFIKIVSPGYLEENNISVPENLKEEKIATQVFVLVDDKLVGAISLADEIRDESKRAIDRLKKSDIKCLMITGDNEEIAAAVSEELGLDGYFAEVLPDEKEKKIKELQNKGEFVAMTGDGINDAPALARADIGIAVGSGTDIAAETADIILVESNPQDISALIIFGKATYKKMIQNLFWATGYNVVAIPLAAGVLYNFGIVISPALGAALMSLSTIIVAINAQFLSIKNN